MGVDLKALAESLREICEPHGQDYMLTILKNREDAAGGIDTAFTTTVEHSDAARILRRISVTLLKDEPSVYGTAAGELPSATKIAMLEMLEHCIGLTEQKGITRAHWRDLMLVWAINEAHDQNITQADFFRGVYEAAEEEWSTPNTAGRDALNELLQKAGGADTRPDLWDLLEARLEPEVPCRCAPGALVITGRHEPECGMFGREPPGWVMAAWRQRVAERG